MSQEQIVLYIGEIETQNYAWRFAGSTPEEVRTLAEATWLEHQKKTGAYFTWQVMSDSLFIYAAQAGQSLSI